MPDRVQRYKLTAEIVLKDKGDYAWLRKRIEGDLNRLSQYPGDVLIDGIILEKMEEPRGHGSK